MDSIFEDFPVDFKSTEISNLIIGTSDSLKTIIRNAIMNANRNENPSVFTCGNILFVTYSNNWVGRDVTHRFILS